MMRWSVTRDEKEQTQTVIIVVSEHDLYLARAKYSEHDRLTLHALGKQQVDDPTLEGFLMMLQIHAKVLERKDNPDART